MSKLYRKAIQIIPAIGWYAYYTQEDGTAEKSKIVCIALYDDGTIEFMDSDMLGDIDNCTVTNLAKIAYEGENGKR